MFYLRKGLLPLPLLDEFLDDFHQGINEFQNCRDQDDGCQPLILIAVFLFLAHSLPPLMVGSDDILPPLAVGVKHFSTIAGNFFLAFRLCLWYAMVERREAYVA